MQTSLNSIKIFENENYIVQESISYEPKRLARLIEASLATDETCHISD